MDNEQKRTEENGSIPDMVMEAAPAYGRLTKWQGEYTVEDYYALPEEHRCELIDGVIYDMAAPLVIHQVIALEMCRQMIDYVERKKGKCLPLISPVDVQLDEDDKTMVQPDVLVVCKREQVRKRVVYGAPDMVAEILSESTAKKDRVIKLRKYREAGVREYWMVDPEIQKVIVYCFGESKQCRIYSFEDEIPIEIYKGECKIDFVRINEKIKELQ